MRLNNLSTYFSHMMLVLCKRRKGGLISLILFALYINDCEMEFIDNNCEPIELKELSLFLIIYADDMVICSESVEGLQMTW
jgi:hypothetical protein